MALNTIVLQWTFIFCNVRRLLNFSAYCESGQELVVNTCRPCMHGYYKSNTGNHAAKFGNCIACPAGKATPGSGSVSEDECIVGEKYEILMFPCSVSYLLRVQQFVSVFQSKSFLIAEDCVLGKVLNEDGTCEDCGIGEYQNVRWRDALPSDSSPYITECKPCPNGTSTSGKGRISESDCTSKLVLYR